MKTEQELIEMAQQMVAKMQAMKDVKTVKRETKNLGAYCITNFYDKYEKKGRKI